MNRTLILALAASLIAVPHVGATHANPTNGGTPSGAPTGDHVHDQYDIPYIAQSSGLGSQVFQGNMKVQVVYRPTVSDNDLSNNLNAASSLVTVTAFGPGTDTDSGAFTLAFVSTTCAGITLLSGSSSSNPGTSGATATWRVALDETQLNPETCDARFSVTRSGGDIDFTMEIPVTFFNTDGQPTRLMEATALQGVELLALGFLLALGMVLAMAGPWVFATVPGATLVALVGVIIMATTTSFLLMLVAFVAIVAAVVRAVQTVLETMNQSKKTR